MLAHTVLVSSELGPMIPICSKTFSLRLLLTYDYWSSNTEVHKSRGPGCQYDKTCTVLLNICVVPQHGTFCVTHLSPRILRRLLDFWKTCAPLTD
jgi:hypothetical protein